MGLDAGARRCLFKSEILVDPEDRRETANVGDEVQSKKPVLPLGNTETPAKLLDEDKAAVCHACERHEIHVWDIHPFIEDIN